MATKCLELDLVPKGNLVLVLGNVEGPIEGLLDEILVSKKAAHNVFSVLNQIHSIPKRARIGDPLWGSGRARYVESQDSIPSIRVRVAADHFQHVSSVFELFLRPDGIVGTQLAKGRAELHLDDDDPAAMLIILLVLFNMPHEVPHDVNVKLLSSICVAIDKYELHGPMSLHTHTWFNARKNVISTVMSNDNFAHWLCITHVLDKQAEFDTLVGVAEQQAENALNFDTMPIPEKALKEIEEYRVMELTRLRTIFNELINDYKLSGDNERTQKLRYTCRSKDFTCNCTYLGALILNQSACKALSSLGLSGFSVSATKAQIKKMQWPTGCFAQRREFGANCGQRFKEELDQRMNQTGCRLFGW